MEKLRLWFPTRNKLVPADYEIYLEEYAAKGWNIAKLGAFSRVAMTLEYTKPKQYCYVFDFKSRRNKQYIEEHLSEGWEYMGRPKGYYAWRKEYTGERPTSFADNSELIKTYTALRNAHYSRFSTFSAIVFLILAIESVFTQESVLSTIFYALMAALNAYWLITKKSQQNAYSVAINRLQPYAYPFADDDKPV